jgi:hypothetical protein
VAKDNREIIHGIRTLKPKEGGGRIAQSITYASGMEDELAANFTDKELKAMFERGDITGNWKSTKGKAPAAPTR